MLIPERLTFMMQELGIVESKRELFKQFLNESARDFASVSASEVGLPADARVYIGYDLPRDCHLIAILQRIGKTKEDNSVMVVIPCKSEEPFSPKGLAHLAAGFIQQKGGFAAVSRRRQFGEILSELFLET
jgi:hypothetical protein